jgi:hypothetical protein
MLLEIENYNKKPFSQLKKEKCLVEKSNL